MLRDLAWRLSDNNRSEIDLELAAGHVASKLSAMRHLEVQDGHRVLEQLRDRSGILRSPVEGRLDFVHRTFQEYLAAEEATEEDRIGNLVGRAHLDLWRETIIIGCGGMRTRGSGRSCWTGSLTGRRRSPGMHGSCGCWRLLVRRRCRPVPAGLAGRLDGAMSVLLPGSPTYGPAGSGGCGAESGGCGGCRVLWGRVDGEGRDTDGTDRGDDRG
ncbi:hypothetical protein ACRAWF_13310 [Streptomyces sp. L7]